MQRDGVISHQKEATMRFTYITVAAVCAVMLAVPVSAKEKKADKAMDQQAMMELWKKAATPGEPHKLFATLVGSWTTQTKEWMEPGKPRQNPPVPPT